MDLPTREAPVERKPKTIKNVEDLARRTFRPNWFWGKLTRKLSVGRDGVTVERDSVIIWSKGLCSAKAVDIKYRQDEMTVYDRSCEKKAGDFAKIYQKLFGEELQVKMDYSVPFTARMF